MEGYQVSNYEYCKNVEKIPTPHPTVIKAHIPKYMPNVSAGNWRQKVAISGNLFVNAPECAVNIPDTVTEQGYCTVKSYSNEVLDFTSKYDKIRKCIPVGNTFLLEVMYEDPETIKLTGKV